MANFRTGAFRVTILINGLGQVFLHIYFYHMNNILSNKIRLKKGKIESKSEILKIGMLVFYVI